MYLTYILIIVPMIILSAFFSGAEMAFNACDASEEGCGFRKLCCKACF